MSSDREIEHGTCSACGGDAMRVKDSTTGAWVHQGPLCWDPNYSFQPREQDAPPRDRQIKEPRRNR
ncbi:hypothetical protein [Streptomyces sp. NPDC048332]|uniref:hypothetical protein n=1 Tax=Streptomyces sp. NPDC048332 TaxID=3154619 RepID=UPI003449FD68